MRKIYKIKFEITEDLFFPENGESLPPFYAFLIFDIPGKTNPTLIQNEIIFGKRKNIKFFVSYGTILLLPLCVSFIRSFHPYPYGFDEPLMKNFQAPVAFCNSRDDSDFIDHTSAPFAMIGLNKCCGGLSKQQSTALSVVPSSSPSMAQVQGTPQQGNRDLAAQKSGFCGLTVERLFKKTYGAVSVRSPNMAIQATRTPPISGEADPHVQTSPLNFESLALAEDRTSETAETMTAAWHDFVTDEKTVKKLTLQKDAIAEQKARLTAARQEWEEKLAEAARIAQAEPFANQVIDLDVAEKAAETAFSGTFKSELTKLQSLNKKYNRAVKTAIKATIAGKQKNGTFTVADEEMSDVLLGQLEKNNENRINEYKKRNLRTGQVFNFTAAQKADLHAKTLNSQNNPAVVDENASMLFAALSEEDRECIRVILNYIVDGTLDESLYGNYDRCHAFLVNDTIIKTAQGFKGIVTPPVPEGQEVGLVKARKITLRRACFIVMSASDQWLESQEIKFREIPFKSRNNGLLLVSATVDSGIANAEVHHENQNATGGTNLLNNAWCFSEGSHGIAHAIYQICRVACRKTSALQINTQVFLNKIKVYAEGRQEKQKQKETISMETDLNPLTNEADSNTLTDVAEASAFLLVPGEEKSHES